MFRFRTGLVPIFLVVGLLIVSGISGMAQDSPGIPEVVVSATNEGLQLSSPQIESGITKFIVDNSDSEEVLDPIIFRVKDDVTMDEFMAGVQEGGLAVFQYLNTYGGLVIPPGETQEVMLDLKPGMHGMLAAGPPAMFEVTEAAGETAEAPEADVTVDFVDFAYGLTGRPLPAGEHLWQFENLGEQPHVAVVIRIDEETSREEAEELIRGVVLPNGDLNPESEADFVFGWPPMTPGETAWLPIELEPGTYAIGCTFPDLAMLPEMHVHLDHGMFRIFHVE